MKTNNRLGNPPQAEIPDVRRPAIQCPSKRLETPVDSREQNGVAAADRLSIEQAYRELESAPGFAAWFGQMPWRVQEVIRTVPPNLYYSLRRGPFPSQILEYCEEDQIVTLKVFVHSVHSPRVTFDVRPGDLRPYRELPRDWQLLLNAKFPPLFDLSKLPAEAFEPKETHQEVGHERKQYFHSDLKKEALRSFNRIARWLFW